MALSIIVPSTGERHQILLETIEYALTAIADVEAEVIVIKRKDKIVLITHPKLRIIDVEFNNVSASRNLGAKLAQYCLLFFIDDDINISRDNVMRCINFADAVPGPYVVSAIWNHSSKVNSLKTNTFLGQMLAIYFPNDSYKTRYNYIAPENEWQDDSCFKSSLTTVFWEPCFSIRRKDYLRVGGMNELFNFGNEGMDFLRRALVGGIVYYVDSTNIVMHNEWDKFNDWSILKKRRQIEAQLINDGRAILPQTNVNYLYKLFYGGLIYAMSGFFGRFLRSVSVVQHRFLPLYFKIFDIYLTAMYWRQIKWSVLRRL